MSYLFLPSNLIPIWELNKQYNTSIILKQNDGGVIERGSANQINNILHIYNFKCFLFNILDYQNTEQFFRDRSGTPFIYNSIIYKCPQWQWTFEENLWILEADFFQVYK